MLNETFSVISLIFKHHDSRIQVGSENFNFQILSDLFAYLVLVECRCVNSRNRQKMLDFVQRMRVERINMYISIYHDVDAVNPSKMGAEISVNSTMDGNFQTCMQWSGKQMSMPIFSPSTNERDEQMQKSDLRRR